MITLQSITSYAMQSNSNNPFKIRRFYGYDSITENGIEYKSRGYNWKLVLENIDLNKPQSLALSYFEGDFTVSVDFKQLNDDSATIRAYNISEYVRRGIFGCAKRSLDYKTNTEFPIRGYRGHLSIYSDSVLVDWKVLDITTKIKVVAFIQEDVSVIISISKLYYTKEDDKRFKELFDSFKIVEFEPTE